MTSEAVLNFLKEHNRPFSLNDILSNLGKEHGKSAVQKSLDKLIEQEKAFEKTYGKQIVYCITQEDANVSSGDGLRMMEQEIGNVAANLKNVEEQLMVNTVEMKNLQSKITTADAKVERENLKQETKELLIKLSGFKENAKPISDEEKRRITTEHEKITKEYLKRKHLCLDLLHAVLEGYPKTKEHLYEDIGIETDEDVGFTME